MSATASVFRQTFFHGTRANLLPGDLLVTGRPSNFRADRPLSWIYFTATLDTAIWGAELAIGDDRARIYVVEPAGEFFDDPNVTDKRFPGAPTLSYRSQQPLRVLGEVIDWAGHDAEILLQRRRDLARMRQEGTDIIID